MGNVAVVVFVLVVVCTIVVQLRRHGDGIVARRGMSIGADLGTMSDRPRVRVLEVTKLGPDRVRLVLAPEPGSDPPGEANMDLLVSLREDDFGFELLFRWQRCAEPLALVIPPGSHLVRLRSIGDLQPLTLNRVDS